jgi:hypothetical protein
LTVPEAFASIRLTHRIAGRTGDAVRAGDVHQTTEGS